MSGTSSNVALVALTGLIGVGLAVGFLYFQSNANSIGDDGDHSKRSGCPFASFSSADKERGGRCPVTGALVPPTNATKEVETPKSPPASEPPPRKASAAVEAHEQAKSIPTSHPSAPVATNVSTPAPLSPKKEVADQVKTPASPKLVEEVKQEQAPAKKNVAQSPPKPTQSKSPASSSPAKPTAPKAMPESPKKPLSPKKSPSQVINEVALIHETALELADSFVDQIMTHSIANVEEEVVDKEEYVQVELTQSTENLRHQADWNAPPPPPPSATIDEDDGVNIASPPPSEALLKALPSVEEAAKNSPLRTSPKKAIAPPSPSPATAVKSPLVSPKVNEKKLPKTPPPSPLRSEVKTPVAPPSPAKTTATPLPVAAATPAPEPAAPAVEVSTPVAAAESKNGHDDTDGHAESEGATSPDSAKTSKKKKSKKNKKRS